MPGVGEITVVVPTRHEAQNIERVLMAFRPLTPDVVCELIFVDDSDDDTPDAIDRAGFGYPVPVRCLHRPPEERTGGLAGAVIAGICAATSPLVGILDADLPHPPRALARLAERMAASAEDPAPAHAVSTPMTGFFVARRDAIDFEALQPDDFKQFLDMLVRQDLRNRGVSA
jgi:glycosyltransferase involved in cell wall biosynthesis